MKEKNYTEYVFLTKRKMRENELENKLSLLIIRSRAVILRFDKLCISSSDRSYTF